ncbi:glycosidase [Paenibacillus sp. DS2015]|uniref:alpha-amylase n=1 Tax=Paenibacillus sp. DS2015 TaxID=3373917 RepID=UPI003D1E3275
MSESKQLERILHFLSSPSENEVQTFWIPALWNQCSFKSIIEESNQEIKVDPHSFLAEHIKYIYELSRNYKFNEQTDLNDSVIYSSLVRYSTAWDYNHDGEIESGTFLRLMILLPLLKEMGVNILYLLPINQYSKLNLKGEIGSPYAVQDLFNLDSNLHDSLLDEMDHLTIHDEMSAMVEACHLLDIKVVLDFIPRVTAKNSVFIEEHPDWVYWIKVSELEGFAPPKIPELGLFEECTPDKLEIVYRSKETEEFLSKFSHPPNVVNPDLWEELKQRTEKTGEELLTLVEQEMGITTSPAHSDWINDEQPVWTDITFLRLYKDVSPQVTSFLQSGQPPYVLFDTIKCNYYPAEEPNQELWDILEQAVRYNLENYGIDGFRIDIGHVLPVPLLANLFRTIKEIRPEALLISEDLFNRNHEKAAKTGYNIMLGSGWDIMTDITSDNLNNYLKELPELKIHVFACAETADTPRITSRGGVKLARLMGIFNHFLPNAIPYLTTGFEMNEEQPLNCGLGDNTNGAVIPRAFFNELNINWTNSNPMLPLLAQLNQSKKQWLHLLKPQNFFINESVDDVVIYGYSDCHEVLLGCFNLNSELAVQLELDTIVLGFTQFEIQIDSELESKWLGKVVNYTILQPSQALIMSYRKGER